MTKLVSGLSVRRGGRRRLPSHEYRALAVVVLLASSTTLQVTPGIYTPAFRGRSCEIDPGSEHRFFLVSGSFLFSPPRATQVCVV